MWLTINDEEQVMDLREINRQLIIICYIAFLWKRVCSLMIAIYHQTKTLFSFWCKRWLNSKSLIQLLETLPVELTETHDISQLFIKLTDFKYFYQYHSVFMGVSFIDIENFIYLWSEMRPTKKDHHLLIKNQIIQKYSESLKNTNIMHTTRCFDTILYTCLCFKK